MSKTPFPIWTILNYSVVSLEILLNNEYNIIATMTTDYSEHKVLKLTCLQQNKGYSLGYVNHSTERTNKELGGVVA